jgi:signal transduction histidine kinase
VFASLAFVIVGGAVLGFLYWSMLSVIDVQIDGALQREYADMNAAYQRGGYERLRRTVIDRASPHDDALRIYLLIAPGGQRSGNLKEWPARAPAPGEAADIVVNHAVGTARVHTLAFGDGSRLLVGRGLSEQRNLRNIVEESLLSVLAANLVLGTGAGLMLARYARRRLSEINAIAQDVLEGKDTAQLAVGDGGDEYDLLARNINSMLGRIQRLVAQVRGVTENIAHDLRTPLNRLRGRLEVALMAPRSSDEYCGELQRAIADADAIVERFNGLLKIARIKAGALSLPKERVNLREVVEELVDLYQVFAEDSGVEVEARFPGESAPARPDSLTGPGVTTGADMEIVGDAHLISQAAANLLDNAIKYSARGGKVTIAVTRDDQGVRLVIADHGPGIPPEKRASTLDRFVRLDAAQNKHGFGLGLNFVSAVAEWHGARLELADNEPGLRASLVFRTGLA